VPNLKLFIYFSCVFDTFIAFPGTVISQHSNIRHLLTTVPSGMMEWGFMYSTWRTCVP